MIVCSCHGITDREIRRLARAGACTVREVAESCGAGSACGGCRASVVAILDEVEAPCDHRVHSISALSHEAA